MRINHNIYSLKIYENYKKALVGQSVSSANISSGIKVNNAADNPYAIYNNEKFNLQLRGLQQASKNSQDTVSLLQTTQGGIDGIQSMLQRIRDLSVQTINGTNSDENKEDAQMEVNQLVKGIDNLAKSTNMNGVNLLTSDNPNAKSTMIGANAGETISIPSFNLQSDAIKDSSGNILSNVNITTFEGAKQAMNIVDSALSTISNAEAKYGALENRFNSNIDNIDAVSINLQSADSDIMDTDIASEMLNYSRESIISQAGTAMLAQANKFPQDVLDILKNVK